MADLLTEQQVLNAVYDPTTGMLKVNVAGMTFSGEVNVDDVLISNPVGNPVNVKLPDGAQAVLDTNSGDIKTAAQAISAILATVIGEDKTLPVSGTVSETNSEDIKNAAEAVQAAVENPTLIGTGHKTVAAAATPEKLVADSTPCRMVLVCAPVNADTGAAVNTKPVFIHETAAAAAVGVPILIDNHSGIYIPCTDASTLYVDAGADGEGVLYAIIGVEAEGD